MIKEHVVINPDIATTLIKEGWELKHIRPDVKTGYKSRAIFVFNVEETDEQQFDDRLNDLKNEIREKTNKIKSISIPISTSVPSINIDMLVLELTKVADAIVKDVNKNFNNKIDELIKAVNNVSTSKLDNIKININPDEVGELGQKLIQEINKKSK